MRMLEHKRASKPKHHAQYRAHREHYRKDPHAMEDGADVDDRAAEARQCVEHDNGDSIVQDALAKHNTVQLGVDLVGVENGEDSYWVSCTQCAAKDETVKERDAHSFKAE